MHAITRTLLLALAALAGFVLLSTCTKKPSSPDLNDSQKFPGQPFELTVRVSDQQIEITWSINNPESIRLFRIHRHDTTSTRFVTVDSTASAKYIDRRVRNGVTYFYQISAISEAGYEGLRSEEIFGTPGYYELRIAGGAGFTAATSVILSISAPAATEFMTLSNDSTFASAVSQAFAATTTWTLTGGDGVKTVYARFRDREGNQTGGLISDTIVLDTAALIQELTENTGGQAKQSGDIIHFTLKANEPNGTASVTIDQVAVTVTLYDDGSRGDRAGNDGTYELDYRVPDNIEVTLAKITGTFTDRVGNQAEPVTAPTLITIQKTPEPVQLFQPTLVGAQNPALRLAWTASSEADFANYSIYRSQTPNFTPGSGSFLDRVTVRQTTSYDDSRAQLGTTYYYQVLVFDAGGLKSKASNEVSGRINPDQPPAAAVLSAPLLLGDGSSQVQLNWSRSTESDFSSYRIYRSLQAQIDSTADLVRSLVDINETIHVDENLQAGTKYYYRVYVFDLGGNSTGSNVANVTTASNAPPTPIDLASPAAIDTGSMRISWSRSTDGDFASYRIYRSTTPGVNETRDFPPVEIINEIGSTTYTDIGLKSKTTYYYRVFVYDRGRLSSGSNEVMGTTR